MIVTTAKDLPESIAADPLKSVALDSSAARTIVPLAGGERPQPASWSYHEGSAPEGWINPDFDDNAWKTGLSGFGADGTPGIHVRTPWRSESIQLRIKVEMPKPAEDDEISLRVFHDEDAEIFVNGKSLKRLEGYSTAYEDISLSAAEKSLFHAGRNIVAVSCRQSSGGQGIDLGLRLIRAH